MIRHEEIERLAADLVRDSGATEPPVNLRLVAPICDAVVRLDPTMPEDMDGLIIPGWSQHLIRINGRRHHTRRRFTCAHEIGHLFLHCADGGGCLLSTRTQYYEARPEREASQFAAMLLMPPAWVRADLEAGCSNLYDLARRYNVSKQAMRFHLRDLAMDDAESGLPEWVDRCFS